MKEAVELKQKNEKETSTQMQEKSKNNLEIIFSKDEVMEKCMKYFNGDSLASDVWISKYAMKNKEGQLLESSPVDMHKRMAKEFARVEKKYETNLNGKSNLLSEYGQKRMPLSEEKIFNYFDKFSDIIPQGSVMASLGNHRIFASLSNCIVLPELRDSYAGICYADEQLVQLMKRRCGVGVDVSTLRPEGMSVSNAAGTSTGAVSFMDRFSNSTREVAQSGRRGALMITMDINHPDSEKFATIKQDLKRVTGANISLKLSDEFMKAVKKDAKYTHKFPVNSDNPKFTKKVSAVDLWDTVVSCAHKTAEPGLIFWDRQHWYSTSSVYPQYKNISTNPCLTDDTWIMTSDGPVQIKNLIGKPFMAKVNGEEYFSSDNGFFHTGKKEVFEVKTKNGFIVTATENHPFKKFTKISRYKNKTEWTELKELNVGDKIKLNDNRNVVWNGSGNREEGWLLGNLIGDVTFDKYNQRAVLSYCGKGKEDMKLKAINSIKENLPYRKGIFGEGRENTYEIEKHNKTSVGNVELLKLASRFGIDINKNINNEILETTSSEFCKGFVSGWFDADGTVHDNHKKGIGVRLASINLDGLRIVQRMLARIGIISKIYEVRKKEGKNMLPDGKGGYKSYLCQAMHELCVTKKNLILFSELVGFRDEYKTIKLENAIIKNNKRGLYSEKFVDEIVSVEKKCYTDVYDCTILEAHEFDANGISVHNCSEIAMGADSCRLIALNLFGCVKNPFSRNAEFDYEKLYEITYEAQRLMDNLVDLELECIDKILNKIKKDSDPDHIKATEINTWQTLYDSGKDGRRTGLGFTALADTIAALGYKFDSHRASEVIEEIMKMKCKAEFDSSIDMAIERGKFKGFDPEIEKTSHFVKMLKKELPSVYSRMMEHGRRNVSISTVAPNGSLSIIAQTSSGVEPVYMISYMRRKKINPADSKKDIKVDFVDSMGDKWQEFEVFHPKVKMWMEVTGKSNTKESPYDGATAEEIDWARRIKLQAIIQKYTTHSISSTINLPENTTSEKVSEIYMKSWEMGLKGITVYRSGSRSGVLISKEQKKEIEANKYFSEHNAPKRPKALEADVIHFVNGGEKWIGFVGLLDERPYEVFTGKEEHFPIPASVESGKITRSKIINRKGEKVSRYDFSFIDKNDEEVLLDGLNKSFDSDYWNYSKMISGILRHGMPLPYAIDLVTSLNLAGESLNTWKAGVARMLKRYIKDGTSAKDTKCPECGDEKGLVYEEGCLKCKSCGNSKCS